MGSPSGAAEAASPRRSRRPVGRGCFGARARLSEEKDVTLEGTDYIISGGESWRRRTWKRSAPKELGPELIPIYITVAHPMRRSNSKGATF